MRDSTDIPAQGIFSSDKRFVEQQRYVFDNLWNQATPSQIRIREIETGIQPEVLHTIKDPNEIIEIGNKSSRICQKRDPNNISYSKCNASTDKVWWHRFNY